MSDDFHEIWWIASDAPEEWGGLRIAHFRKTVSGDLIVVIQGEVDPRRRGVRVWADIERREGWFKIVQIVAPSVEQIAAALR